MGGLLLSLLLAASPVRAERPRSFLSTVPAAQLTCGRPGVTVPVLLNGGRGIAACVLKYRPGRSSVFGPLDF